MAISYNVAAQIVDIRTDTPKSSDAFLVDTNVWYWVTYTRATMAADPPRAYQTTDYPRFISAACRNKATLRRCGLSLAELAHRIERTEREIYEVANPSLRPSGCRRSTGWMPHKEYRHNLPAERANVATEVKTAWDQVKLLAEPLDLVVDDPTADSALARFRNEPLDGYDLFMVEVIAKAGIVQVLTDDGDYCTVPGIQVFTANQRVIAAAGAAGKLVVR